MQQQLFHVTSPVYIPKSVDEVHIERKQLQIGCQLLYAVLFCWTNRAEQSILSCTRLKESFWERRFQCFTCILNDGCSLLSFRFVLTVEIHGFLFLHSCNDSLHCSIIFKKTWSNHLQWASAELSKKWKLGNKNVNVLRKQEHIILKRHVKKMEVVLVCHRTSQTRGFPLPWK